MLFFTDELEHTYTRIFRFLEDILNEAEYTQVDFLSVTKFIERIQAVQTAASLYQKPNKP